MSECLNLCDEHCRNEGEITEPLLHLNGSGFDNLRASAEKAYRVTQEALDAMHAAFPHGRDYYPLGDAVYLKARAEWQVEIRRLEQVSTYLEQWISKLYQQAEYHESYNRITRRQKRN